MRYLVVLLSMTLLGAGIDPGITEIKSAEVRHANGDYFRYVLFNTELDACILLEKVNLRGKVPQVKSSERICELRQGKTVYSLKERQHQEFAVEGLTWNGGVLELQATFTPGGPSARTMAMQCRLDTNGSARHWACDSKEPAAKPAACAAPGEAETWMAKYCGYVVGSDDLVTIGDSPCFRLEMKDESRGCERSVKLKAKICEHLMSTYKTHASVESCLADPSVKPSDG